MLNNILLYLGAAILFVWGVAHIIPTRNVVAGFGALSDDNRINITDGMGGRGAGAGVRRQRWWRWSRWSGEPTIR